MSLSCNIKTAEDVIRKWLKEVEHTDAGSSCTGYTSTPAVATTLTTREEVDYLGSLDWCDGNVADSAKSVVERLLKKDLQSLTSPSSASSLATKRSHDPRIAMEMRHKKVLVQQHQCIIELVRMASSRKGYKVYRASLRTKNVATLLKEWGTGVHM